MTTRLVMLGLALTACGAPGARGSHDGSTMASTANAVLCRGMDAAPADEMGETLVEVCREAVGPIARNDTEAWLALASHRLVVSRSLLRDATSNTSQGAIRTAAREAGGLRQLFGLPNDRPIVVEVVRDCRRCVNPYLILRANGRPGVELVIEGWSPRRITQVRRIVPAERD